MSINVLSSDKAPAAIGPYSQATQVGNTVYVSGQLPIDAQTGIMPQSIAAQTTQSLQNIADILKEAGMTMQNVVQATVLLSDINDFSAMNEVYGKFFQAPYPARMAYQVACLPKNAKVEIAVIAAEK